MFHVILVAPEIPPNTGNVIRLCANTGARLHLVKPLGFDLSAAQLRRAGMDYLDLAIVTVHDDWTACHEMLKAEGATRLFALTIKGTRPYASSGVGNSASADAAEDATDAASAAPRFLPDDAFVFGSESSGLPAHVLADIVPERRLRLPMMPNNRCLNLSNTVAIVVFEAWRQNEFSGGA